MPKDILKIWSGGWAFSCDQLVDTEAERLAGLPSEETDGAVGPEASMKEESLEEIKAELLSLVGL